MSIFKAYDIRGIVPDQLDPELALQIGRAYGVFLGAGPIAIGRDMRETSTSLSEALMRGIQDTGVDVIDLGMTSTPMLNYAVAARGYAGGIMVTASHNPGQYNGFKLCREKAIPISGDTGIVGLETWIQESASSFTPKSERGERSRDDIREDYRAFVQGAIEPGSRRLKVAVDGGNGMIGYVEHALIEQLFPDTVGIYLEPDGNFPNHEANPLIESNLDDLRKLVRDESADVGVAFDGDGDRVVFVDETGATVMADLVLALLAESMLAHSPGAGVLYDLRSSKSVPEAIESAGGRPVLSRVGHAFIKKTLRDEDGILGGELSGHFYFKDFYFLDSGILGALRLLELLSRTEGTLSERMKPLDRYPRTGEINFRVEDADRVLERIEEAMADRGALTYLDGLSFDCEEFWFNVRKSNTEPLVRLNLQAQDAPTLERVLPEVENLIGGARADH